jgi:protein gp37
MTGCTNGCEYCYARKIAMRFDGHFNPTFHKDRLDQPAKLKKPSHIFVCSMGDLFDGEAKISWGDKVFEVMAKNIIHEFYVLTKQPQHIKHNHLNFKHNIMVGVSINLRGDLWRLDDLRRYWEGHKFVSIEPLLGNLGRIDLKGIEWIIIGGQTGTNRIIPDKKWVEDICVQAKKSRIPVFIKNNCINKE